MNNILVIGIYPHVSLGAVVAYETDAGMQQKPCISELIQSEPTDDIRQIHQRYVDCVYALKKTHEGTEIHSVNIFCASKMGDKPGHVKLVDQSRMSYLIAGRMLATEHQVNVVSGTHLTAICTAHRRYKPRKEPVQIRHAAETAYAVMCSVMHEALLILYPNLTGW